MDPAGDGLRKTLRSLPALCRALVGVGLMAGCLAALGCSRPGVSMVEGRDTRGYPPLDAPAADPLTKAADQLLARMLAADFVTAPSDPSGPIPMAIQAFRLHDPAPPADLVPVGDVIRARLFAGLEAADTIQAIHASPIPGTPALINHGDPPRMTLCLEVFRLLDVPKIPDRAFYFVRLWAFDLHTRTTRWEASSDPIAWPVTAAADPSPPEDSERE